MMHLLAGVNYLDGHSLVVVYFRIRNEVSELTNRVRDVKCPTPVCYLRKLGATPYNPSQTYL